MNELIKISTSDNGEKTISARELYQFLTGDNELKNFNQWASRNIDNNMFAISSVDYQTIRYHNELSNRQMIDYLLTIDFAKELSMLSQCEKGKQARQYFIACEKELVKMISLPNFNDPADAAIAWAEQYRAKQLAETKVKELAPKAIVYDLISDCTNLKTVADVAKEIGTGRNRLFEFLREKSILMANNLPYQKYIDNGYFIVKTNVIESLNKSQSQTYFTSKGEVWIASIFK